jgi:two-component system CheB/CheR fusion protein
MDGFALLAQLKAKVRSLPVIMITGQGDVRMAVQAMKAGAMDFIEKPFDREELLASIHRALERAANASVRSSWRAAAAARIAGLTRRQREIMDLVVAGISNKEIAARLHINQRTVETHRALVMNKTGAASLAELVRIALAASGRENESPVGQAHLAHSTAN